MKKCSKCGKLKPENAFNKNHKAKDGLDHRCKKCVRLYRKKYISNPEIHKKELERKRIWDDKNLKRKRANDLKQKIKKRFTGRVLGTSNIGQKLSRKYNGEPDFKREFRIIRRERNFMLKKGNKWFTFGCNQRMTIENINFYLREVDRVDFFNNMSDDFVLDWNNDEFNYFICPFCKKGIVIQPMNPHSYEYTPDGIPIQICTNCNVVVNWSDGFEKSKN